MVFECCFELFDEVREGSDSDDSAADGILLEGSCPSEGGSLGHIGQGEGDFLIVIIIDFLIVEEVVLYGIQPLGGFVVGSVKGFRCSDTEFGGFQSGHRRGGSGDRWRGRGWCVG